MKRLAKVIIFLAAFIAVLIVCFPKEEAGSFVMSVAAKQLSPRGIRIEYSDVRGAPGGIIVNNLKLSGGVNVRFREVMLRPEFMGSILGLAPMCYVEFKGCSVQIGTVLTLGDGHVMVRARMDEIELEDMRTNGELGINGSLAVSPSTQKITHAQARVNVPEALEPHMGLLQSLLPLVQDNGRWYLRR